MRNCLVNSSLETAYDGEQLMEVLTTNMNNVPDILFLDLSMPRKTGVECLLEIKRIEKLKHLPVIIYSASLDPQVVDLLYASGASRYIRKPGGFSQLKKVILEAVNLSSESNTQENSKENFVIQP
ncbi:MAG TPA: response regulator [Chitinophagales bacterium]|nr:response regulator [Chitinophagales bacterium]